MSAFIYGIITGWKIDFRNKSILLVYYIVPLVFFAFMGGIFTSINPLTVDTITQTMIVFCISMGAFIGTPTPLVELFSSEIKKTYIVSNIPLWTVALNNFISAFIHLSIVSLIITIVSPIAFGAKFPPNIYMFVLGFVLLLLSSLALGTVLGLIVKKVTKITIFGQALFLPSLMLSGIMFPSDMLPEALQTIGKIFPATWGFEFMQSNHISFDMFIPALLTIGLCFAISFWRISKLNVD